MFLHIVEAHGRDIAEGSKKVGVDGESQWCCHCSGPDGDAFELSADLAVAGSKLFDDLFVDFSPIHDSAFSC